jgi:AcrR family transcriptional regulator
MRTQTRTERRKQRTSEAILDAAEPLFLEHGFHQVSVQQIADEADVALGTLYAHFGSKEGIYAALVDRAMEIDEQYMTEAHSLETPEARIAAVADAYLRFYRDHPGAFRLFVFGNHPGDPSPGEVPEATSRVARRAEDEMTRLAAAIEEWVESGTIRPVDPKRAAVFLWAAWNGLIAMHMRRDSLAVADAEFEALLNEARQILTYGLLADEARHSP